MRLPKDLYGRITSWMAYAEDPELWYADFHESREHGLADGQLPYHELNTVTQMKVAEAAKDALKEEAFDIMSEVYGLHEKEVQA